VGQKETTVPPSVKSSKKGRGRRIGGEWSDLFEKVWGERWSKRGKKKGDKTAQWGGGKKTSSEGNTRRAKDRKGVFGGGRKNAKNRRLKTVVRDIVGVQNEKKADEVGGVRSKKTNVRGDD